MTPEQISELSDDEISLLVGSLSGEIERRRSLRKIPEQMDAMNAAYLAASGVVQGEPWQQSTAYPSGWAVEHGGITYTSQIANNVWEPGNTADPQAYRWWKADAPEPVPDDETGRLPWDGEGHDYSIGDEVDYEGTGYRVRQAHTSQPGWTPTIVPALYETI